MESTAREKRIHAVKLSVDEPTLRALQDWALAEDRSVADLVHCYLRMLIDMRAHGVSLARRAPLGTDCE